jgi:hypothetical protein
MGLFDFLKGKAKRTEPEREPQSMQEALDALGEKLGGEPRFWHYFVAHVALRDFALRGEGLPEAAADPDKARGFFAMILGKMADHLGLSASEAERLAEKFTVVHRRIGGYDAAIVRLPSPRGPTECHFVALLHAQNGLPARFFTLEDAGGGVSILGGWSADEKHLNFGEGPAPTIENFVAAVSGRL